MLVGVLVGVLVGLLGVGGSIVTVPALMLLLGLTATQATATSLVVVAVVSAASLAAHALARRVDWRSGLGFAAIGVPAALVGAVVSVLLSDLVLTVLLVLLLLSTGVWMWQRRSPGPSSGRAGWTRIVPAALAVGLVTGTLGVGGGFVIVPGLVALVGLSLPRAVGTAQLVLIVNAVAGLVGRAGTGTVDLLVGLTFALGGVLGALIAGRVTGRLPEWLLARVFSALVVAAALALAIDAGFAG